MKQHGARVLSRRDRELLGFIADQYLVTLPQLAYLAGRSERTARWLRTRWQRAGLADAAPLLTDEPTVVWLTRRGLAAVGLPWKSVRPTVASVQTLATVAELRIAMAERYPSATWLSRRHLAHAQAAPGPLPDALLTRGPLTVAVVVKAREVDRRDLDRQVTPLLSTYGYTLLVLPRVSRHARAWIEEQPWPAAAIDYRRDPRHVSPERLGPPEAVEELLYPPIVSRVFDEAV